MNCNRITVKNQVLSNTCISIELYSCLNCFISNNILKNNPVGIYISGSSNTVCKNYIEKSINAIYIIGSNNAISNNNITKNTRGIYWSGKSNTVEYNNFISNLRDAEFHMSYGSLKNKWNENYWDKSRNFPKFITGIKDVLLFEDYYWGVIILLVPWVGFDWHPAKEPYEIGLGL
jgi:parallel beta-helix repeat protein